VPKGISFSITGTLPRITAAFPDQLLLKDDLVLDMMDKILFQPVDTGFVFSTG
jgi:hypothetical protein